MGAARRKLHEQRGASMLMALLLLLVALTVSSRHWWSRLAASSGSGAFLGFVQYAVPVLYKDSKANVNHWTYKLSLEGMEDVWAVFSITYGDNKGAADEGKAYILTVELRNYEDDAAPGEHPCSMTLTLYSNLKNPGDGQTVNWNGHNVIE